MPLRPPLGSHRSDFRLRHFFAFDAPANYTNSNAALNDSLTRLNLTVALIFGFDHAIGDNLLFADMDLRSFLGGQRRAHARHFIVLERALRFAPAHP